MIKNNKQYKVSINALAEMKQGLEDLRSNSDQISLSPNMKKAQEGALKGIIEDLEAQIKEYTQLKNDDWEVIEINNINLLPQLLIKIRIIRGLSQKELANKIGIAEQQIQRYEARDYESASLSRILEVAYALDIRDRIQLKVMLRDKTKIEAYPPYLNPQNASTAPPCD